MKIKSELKASVASIVAVTAGTVPAAADDFDGFYLGAFAGTQNGWIPNYYGDSYSGDYQFENNVIGGVFAGFNTTLQNDLVVGAEVAFSPNNISSKKDTGSSGSDYEQKSMLDLKFKVGKDLGRTLVYGFAGASFAEYHVGYDYGGNGWNVGLGVEYNVNENFFVGAEATMRGMSNSYEDNATANTLSIRGGWRF